MGSFVNQFSEIGKLNAVMLHRPEDEVDQVTPDLFAEMLIDDTLYLPAAQRDHDAFAKTLRDSGAKVYYLGDLFCEVIENDALRRAYIEDFMQKSMIKGDSLREAVRNYLSPMKPRELFHAVLKGVRAKDLEGISPRPINVAMRDAYPFLVDPMPNTYFTRDTSICIGNGMVVSSMSMRSRDRETLFTRYIHDHHPLFSDSDRKSVV